MPKNAFGPSWGIATKYNGGFIEGVVLADDGDGVSLQGEEDTLAVTQSFLWIRGSWFGIFKDRQVRDFVLLLSHLLPFTNHVY